MTSLVLAGQDLLHGLSFIVEILFLWFYFCCLSCSFIIIHRRHLVTFQTTINFCICLILPSGDLHDLHSLYSAWLSFACYDLNMIVAYQVNSRLSDVFSQVVTYLSLRETEYFGLAIARGELLYIDLIILIWFSVHCLYNSNSTHFMFIFFYHGLDPCSHVSFYIDNMHQFLGINGLTCLY